MHKIYVHSTLAIVVIIAIVPTQTPSPIDRDAVSARNVKEREKGNPDKQDLHKCILHTLLSHTIYTTVCTMYAHTSVMLVLYKEFSKLCEGFVGSYRYW